MDVSLAVSVTGTAAGIAAAWFGYLPVRHLLRRRGETAAAPPRLAGDAGYDAFISYAEADAALAERLALGLRSRGVRVFLRKWVAVGLVEYLEKDAALRTAANGILLFSDATMRDPAIRDDYAAVLQRVHHGGRLFIPVLVGETDLPPYARIRKPLDLVRPGDRAAQLDELAELIRSRPARGREPTS